MKLNRIIGKEITTVYQDHRKSALSFRCKDQSLFTLECEGSSAPYHLSTLKNCGVLYKSPITGITCEDYGWRECNEGFEAARRYLIHTKKGAAEFSLFTKSHLKIPLNWIAYNDDSIFTDHQLWSVWDSKRVKLSDKFLNLIFFIKKTFFYNNF